MSWDPSEHPRAAAGAAGGGQFAPLGYDSAKKTGTGYGKKDGDPRVKAAQEALNRMGVKDAGGKPLAEDGKLGPKTTASIKAYQRSHGIKPADGKITPALLSALKKAGGKPKANPKARLGGAIHKKSAPKPKGAVKRPKAKAKAKPTPITRDPALR
jgi:putative chitinase